MKPGQAEPEQPRAGALSVRLMALSPVNLFRLTSLEAGPELRPRLALALPGVAAVDLWATILVGWLIWLVAPLAVGLRRLLRADLS